MSIVMMDTSVFCNILNVPGLNQDYSKVYADLKAFVGNGDTLLLPMAAVLETGNHIAQVPDGQLRRKAAVFYCSEVSKAIVGNAPWIPTRYWEIEQLTGWLGEFPDHAMRGVGMGDLSIIKEWELQCELHRGRRVRIWSLDSDLQGYDRAGEIR